MKQNDEKNDIYVLFYFKRTTYKLSSMNMNFPDMIIQIIIFCKSDFRQLY
jgi:hypothetical protein